MAKRKDYLGKSLAASLLLHVAVLSLQFGVPGMGLPWPGFALDERKASIPTIRAVLRSSQEPAAIAQPAIPMVPPAKIHPPVPKKLKHRVPKVKKLAVGKKHLKPVPVVQPKQPPLQAAPTPVPVPVVPVPITASMEKVKEPAVPQVDREEIVKPVVKVEKQKTQSDEIAVLSTEKESSWQLNTASPSTVTSEVQAEAQKEQIAREAKIREQQLAEEREEQRQKAQAQALAAKKAEERERASKEEAADALEKARAEAQALAVEKQMMEEQAAMEKVKAAALEKKRNEALLQAAAEEKIRQEQIALAREKDEAERTAKSAALAREEESRRKEEQVALAKAKEEARRKEEQAALAKAKEDALAKAIQAEARAREQAAAAAAANAANAAAEMNRAAERGARNPASTADGKAEGNKQGGGTPAKGVDLARRAIDMARSGLSGLPVKAPIETERPRRGSILGRNPSDIQLAFYGESWTQKIERIASVNYPKLNRNVFYGSLVLSVSINSDGSVATRRIVRSSGNKELDEAVLRIVDMCSPFAAFPPDLKRNYDVVEVTRTLSFPEKPPVIISQ